MTNLLDSQSIDFLARHQDDYRPVGFEYLYQDDHNKHKFHHIVINSDGERFYNQTIERDGQYQDFYEWELLTNRRHGYQRFIEEAVRDLLAHSEASDEVIHVKRGKTIPPKPEAGDTFKYWNNQGFRDAAVLGILGAEALICFEMPNGNEYLHVVRTSELARKMGYNSAFLRNVSWNKVPKKWMKAAGWSL